MPHPPNRLNTIKVIKGQTKVLSVSVKTKAGKPANLNGASMFMSARKDPNGAVVITKTLADGIQITDSANGEVTITLSSADTDVPIGAYRYDVWVTFPGTPETRMPVVQFAQMQVVDSVTTFA